MISALATDLPIEPLIPDIVAALQASPNLVLEAPPGAGKTTRVPLALLDASWAKAGKIIVLEPRRLAARSAATRMAALLGETVGERVGYRVRSERKIGPRTRIEAVTTGLFMRQLQADPELPGVAAILFDEFHERSIDGDLALALSIEAQLGLRPDLRLLVMSATLDGIGVADIVPGAGLIRSEGKSFPVETIHLGDDQKSPLELRLVAAIRRALAEAQGDILVFLPGLREIRRQQASIEASGIASGIEVLTLHGDLPLAEQDRVVRGARNGNRRIILSTSIAETSITIAGVGAVVDSGLKRRPRFDPVSGMSYLETAKVSLAAANQRRGRAGRLGPGSCYRLWSAATERGMAKFDHPEIADSDLAPLALELAIWGSTDPERLRLLTQPPLSALAQARDLLLRLDAIEPGGRATAHGRAMAELGAHPRIAHMMLRAHKAGQGALACDVAAILSERDMIRGRSGDCDLRHRLSVLKDLSGQSPEFDREQVSRIKRASAEWRRQLRIQETTKASGEFAGSILALAYPDRLAQGRGQIGQYRLANGRGAVLEAADRLAKEEYLAIGSLDGDKRNARIFLAAPITLAEIETEFADQIAEREIIAWNPRSEAVEAKRERHLGSLVLKEWPIDRPAPDQLAHAMIEGVRAMGIECLPWNKESRSLQSRVAFLRDLEGERKNWPDLSDEALIAGLEVWLLPWLAGKTRRQHLAELDLVGALVAQLDWPQRKRLDEWAPTHLVVPSGSRVALDYTAPGAPVMEVRLQEMFGASQTPRVADGRVNVTLRLLSPARRPVQTTTDLGGFWANSYHAVRADLRGRYPRHYWPDNPLVAEPTARAKPKGK